MQTGGRDRVAEVDLCSVCQVCRLCRVGSAGNPIAEVNLNPAFLQLPFKYLKNTNWVSHCRRRYKDCPIGGGSCLRLYRVKVFRINQFRRDSIERCPFQKNIYLRIILGSCGDKDFAALPEG